MSAHAASAAAAQQPVPPSVPPSVRAWWPGRGVLAVTALAYRTPDHEPAKVEVEVQEESATLAAWRSALKSAVVRARLTEPVDPAGLRVRLTLALEPVTALQAEEASADDTIGKALAETAAVLVDRAARQLLRLPDVPSWVLATSTAWEHGALQPLPDPWVMPGLRWLREHASGHHVYLALPGGLPEDAPAQWRAVDHVNQLSGQLAQRLAPSRTVRSYEAWFPTIGARGPELNSVRVVVSPLVPGSDGAVQVLGTMERSARDRVTTVLETVRRHDHGSTRWNTWVHFSGPSFDGRSFELALAVADRIARGREWAGAGRVLATGAIEKHTGTVLNVEERPPQAGDAPNGAGGKLELLQREARLYDTLLLPQAWEEEPPASPAHVAGRNRLSFSSLPPAPEYAQPQVIYLAALPH